MKQSNQVMSLVKIKCRTLHFSMKNVSGKLCKPGSCGQAYRGVINTILDPDDRGVGEIATRSRNIFMGYIHDEQVTRSSFNEDGWFKSGDLGHIDSEGFLTFKGRIKELIVTSGGKNIAPVPIENLIKKELKYIASNVVVVGDEKPYLTCLITPLVKVDPKSTLPTTELDPSAQKWAKKHSKGEKITTSHELLTAVKENENLRKAFEAALENVNKVAKSNPERVQKFMLLPEDFSIPGGELGPTLKLKRYFVYDKYKPVINEMYQ